MKTIAIPALAAALAIVVSSHAASIISLDGNTEHENWSNLTSSNHTGFPGYPGSGDWPNAILSDSGSSNNATFDKLSGTGLPSTNAIYSSGGGIFTVIANPSLVNIATVVFQIDIGIAFYDGSTAVPSPTISYNNGTQALNANFTNTNTSGTYEFSGTTYPITTLSFQWDLSGLSDAENPIENIEIQWSVAAHDQIYQLRLDTSDAPHAASVVPEPSSALIAVFGGLALLFRRRRMA